MLVPLSAFGAALIAAYWYIYSSTPNAITNTLDSATLRYQNVFTALAPLIFGRRNANNYQRICEIIAFNISSESAVHYPGSKSYDNNIYHWASSGTQQSACSVEPGSTEDVGRILRILGATLTPFGVKSGGHMVNPGSSSTPGVEIALTRFNKVKYNPTTQTVEFGSGLVFDDVYTALEPYNVSVAGARVSRIGVGGFMLGGGYSWKTNEYGLAIDNTLAYELVKPDGNVVKVTELSDSELFFGLKGGFNNFGIVTQFTMNALPQPSIWAGTISYPPSSVSEVTKAIIKFCENSKDPKANIAFAYNLVDGKPTVSGFVYYDGPSPPPGLFDDFLKIPAVSQSVHERSLMDFIKEANLNAFIGLRGIFNTVPLLKTSPSIMEVILNETTPLEELLKLLPLPLRARIVCPSVSTRTVGTTDPLGKMDEAVERAWMAFQRNLGFR
ncbi:hypothetical protein APHAL10511_005329 [Amanita phalloides]|nr:hypothetical protein APHAL10511_005329 [Amanita phalloides]